MPFTYNGDHVRELIDGGSSDIRDAVAKLVDDLIDHGAIRIPAQVCSTYAERKAIIERSTSVALLSVLTTDCSMLDEETKWLYVTRTERKNGGCTMKLSAAWTARLKLRAEGDKLRAEGDKIWAESAKLKAESAKLKAENDKLWAQSATLKAEGDKIWAESDKEGDKIWAESAKLKAEGAMLWAQSDKIWAEGDKIWAESATLKAEGATLWAESTKLWAESATLKAEGEKLWAEAILESYGNIKLEWRLSPAGDCILENGEHYRADANEPPYEHRFEDKRNG